jgi:heat-inducible transcriptional repressor
MGLGERKMRILEAIINDYISSAEPVGSRTIARKYDWGLSSATIRNEMSDLEEMGLIAQPYASAGRVPSDAGYRLYVDTLLKRRALTPEEEDCLRQVVEGNIDRIDGLMRETARCIAHLTNYTTVVTESPAERDVIKRLQLVPVDGSALLMVVVGGARVYQNQIIRVGEAPDAAGLSRLTDVLNKHLTGKSPGEIDGGTLAEIAEEFGDKAHILRPVAEGINAAFGYNEGARYYTGGMNNILAFPEFSDINRARGLFKAMEERRVLITLFEGGMDVFRILIGSENSLLDMRDCAVVTAGYGTGRNAGAIGVIGPTRMNYSQVISVLHGIVGKINDMIKNAEEG